MTPLGPLGARPYRFEQKYCPNRLCAKGHPEGFQIFMDALPGVSGLSKNQILFFKNESVEFLR